MTRNRTATLVALTSLAAALSSGCALGADRAAAGLTEAPYVEEATTADVVLYDRAVAFNETTRESEMLEATAIPSFDGRIETVELVLTTGAGEYVYILEPDADAQADLDEREAFFARVSDAVAAQLANAEHTDWEHATLADALPSPGQVALRHAFHDAYAAARAAEGYDVAPFAPDCGVDGQLSSEQLQALSDCIRAQR